jgi:small subunit ribosomal protein S8
MKVYLRYDPRHKPVIQGLRRDSRGGLRKYVRADAVPRVLGGLGFVILSTSMGVMTGREARRKGIGGEWLCSVW